LIESKMRPYLAFRMSRNAIMLAGAMGGPGPRKEGRGNPSEWQQDITGTGR
jgi:hypothetical protein